MSTMLKPWDSKFITRETAKNLGDRHVYDYVAFKDLTPANQTQAIRSYPHKHVGAKYDFGDEHYYYPVKRTGGLSHGQRVLAIPYAQIQDNEYMKSLGYEINEGWVDKTEDSMGVPVMAVEIVRTFMERADYAERVSEAVLVTRRQLGEASEPVVKALGVFLLSENLREPLAGNDPKAVIQALRAIGINLQ